MSVPRKTSRVFSAAAPRRAFCAVALSLLLSAGCAGNTGRAIPTDAMDLGGGRAVTVIAPANGKVWIYSKQKDLILYKSTVRVGDRITINAASNNLEIAGRKVELKEPLEHRGRYRIYFKK
jgi:hypothetical protein